jgi:hypothetical protein
MESKWTFVSGFDYAGQTFSVWCQPMRRKDGKIDMASKVEETTKEKMLKDKEEAGIHYFSK